MLQTVIHSTLTLTGHESIGDRLPFVSGNTKAAHREWTVSWGRGRADQRKYLWFEESYNFSSPPALGPRFTERETSREKL